MRVNLVVEAIWGTLGSIPDTEKKKMIPKSTTMVRMLQPLEKGHAGVKEIS